MQLVEAGEIQLEAELSRHLDVFSNRVAGAITVRQLRSHTRRLAMNPQVSG